MQRNLVKHFEKKETQEVKKAKTNLALKKVSASFFGNEDKIYNFLESLILAQD